MIDTSKIISYLNSVIGVSKGDCIYIDCSSSESIKKENLSKKCIVNLHRVNDIRYINKLFETINKKMVVENFFVCCIETLEIRSKKRIGLNRFIWNFIEVIEFIFLRIIPKLGRLKNLFFKITKGKNRLISKAEILGRLVSCGFKIRNYNEIDGMLYIVSEKYRDPFYDKKPSYGLIYSMPRIGMNKKIISVYKVRSMYPFSEYLQSFMLDKFGSSNGDKINNDFRVSKAGRIIRMFWIDEIPMLINVLKGEMKLVGVRPLSVSKFNLYPKFAQEARIKCKPGCIPPFYADLPKSFDELVDSEMKYLTEYENSPLLTDVKYFILAIHNILIKGARSK